MLFLIRSVNCAFALRVRFQQEPDCSKRKHTALPKLNDLDLDKICFESDSMQVLSLSRNDRKVEFPLTQAPINFAVLRSDGSLSNRWGVKLSGKGDAYVYCRDVQGAEKVSLHASGRQHISITSELAARIGSHSRFGPEWMEPEFEHEAIATFRLVFPPWGGGMRAQPLKRFKDELWVVGHRENLVVVCFFIIDSAKRMRGRLPHFVLGQLPLRPGKTLHIIAWKEPQNDLMERIRSVFPQVSPTLAEMKLREDDYSLCLQGYQGPNSAFMVTIPVHYTPPSKTT